MGKTDTGHRLDPRASLFGVSSDRRTCYGHVEPLTCTALWPVKAAGLWQASAMDYGGSVCMIRLNVALYLDSADQSMRTIYVASWSCRHKEIASYA